MPLFFWNSSAPMLSQTPLEKALSRFHAQWNALPWSTHFPLEVCVHTHDFSPSFLSLVRRRLSSFFQRNPSNHFENSMMDGPQIEWSPQDHQPSCIFHQMQDHQKKSWIDDPVLNEAHQQSHQTYPIDFSLSDVVFFHEWGHAMDYSFFQPQDDLWQSFGWHGHDMVIPQDFFDQSHRLMWPNQLRREGFADLFMTLSLCLHSFFKKNENPQRDLTSQNCESQWSCFLSTWHHHAQYTLAWRTCFLDGEKSTIEPLHSPNPFPLHDAINLPQDHESYCLDSSWIYETRAYLQSFDQHLRSMTAAEGLQWLQNPQSMFDDLQKCTYLAWKKQIQHLASQDNAHVLTSFALSLGLVLSPNDPLLNLSVSELPLSMIRTFDERWSREQGHWQDKEMTLRQDRMDFWKQQQTLHPQLSVRQIIQHTLDLALLFDGQPSLKSKSQSHGDFNLDQASNRPSSSNPIKSF